MKQPEHRANGKVNLFPELAPGISIVYRVSLRPKKGNPERRITIRVYNGLQNRMTMHINRDNYRERYDEAVGRLIELNALTKKMADKYDGIVSWQEILDRFGLEEEQVIRYSLSEPDDWVDPQLNRIGFKSEHVPRKRKRP